MASFHSDRKVTLSEYIGLLVIVALAVWAFGGWLAWKAFTG